ncbi:MAG: DUF362 domain-containing protein [Clostridia bacterium]|nr:DUF362 domain-containing protein [Clostridia bacterium]MBQ6374526.1 DUF362 domain-containing protein [Clostridia bacterium]
MKTLRTIALLLACLLLCASPALAADLTLTTNGGVEVALADLPHRDEAAPAAVYFISDISPESLVKAYRALNAELPGRVGVKLSTGESEHSNYLRPALIGDLVRMLDGTIVECNTAYGGSRASTAMHLQLAKDHGFTDIAEVDILDAEDSMEIPVEGGRRLSVDYVGSHFADYDSFLVLSHFKGHAMAGFGGAIKNISIGFSSSMGKGWIHSGGTRTSGSIWGEQDPFLEAMADAAKGVHTYMDGNIVYVSVLNRLSVDCDCDGYPDEPDMHDIGILASADPLAIDQAAVDLVYAMPDSESLVARIESRNGLHTLDAAEAIGLGSRTYDLVVIE